MKLTKSKLLKLVSFILAAVALIFVGEAFWEQREIIFDSISIRQVVAISLVGGVIYLTGNFFLAFSWDWLLNWLGEDLIPVKVNLAIYGRTQILKYIPGNFFALPGRHFLSLEKGIKNNVLLSSATLEIIGLLVSSSFISLLGIITAIDSIVQVTLPVASLVFLTTLLSPLLLKKMYRYIRFLHKFSIFQVLAEGSYAKLLAIWSLYLSFFFTTGVILWWIIISIDIDWIKNVPFLIIISAYSISWFAGFITPGAPAGVGVREGVMIMILSNYIGEASSILVSLLMRLTTMVGDVFFYIISLFLDGNESEK